MEEQKKYYLGLDIGTDSVGYAVTDDQYNLLRFRGQDAWGTHVFDAASLNSERRSFRTARRRLDRRQQRVDLVQELFADAIGRIDPRFFIRLEESSLFRSDCEDKYVLFNDDNYNDSDYYRDYPTIHHLISDLMNNPSSHDVRMVYLACAWLVANRGHFLSNLDRNNIAAVKDFESVYSDFLSFFSNNGYRMPWDSINEAEFAKVLKEKNGITAKYKKLISVLLNDKKPTKLSNIDDIDPEFPFSQEGIIKLLAGGTYSLKDLFGKDEYDSLETKSISLGMDEEKFAGIMSEIGDDFDLISVLRKLYDWAVLVDVLGDASTISEAKKAVFEKHKEDLKTLKLYVRKYCPERYNEIFRKVEKAGANYASYVYHTDEKNAAELKKQGKRTFQNIYWAY